MKYKALVRGRRGQCLSPPPAPALSDNDVLPVFGFFVFEGSQSGGDETP